MSVEVAGLYMEDNLGICVENVKYDINNIK